MDNETVEKILNWENNEFNDWTKEITLGKTYTCVYNIPQRFLQLIYKRPVRAQRRYGTVVLSISKT